MMNLPKWSLWTLLLCLAGTAHAALDEARVVAATPALQSVVPNAQSVTITTAGNYTLTIADLQGSNSVDSAFSSLTAVLSQGAQPIKVLKLPSNVFSTTSPTFTLAAGQYQIQVLGVTSGAAQYSVELKNSSNVSVFSDSDVINAPPSNNLSSVVLNLTQGQSYTVTLSDRAFPVALAQLGVLINQGGTTVCQLTAAGSCPPFVANADGYVLTTLAHEATNSAGLYSIKVANTATGDVAYENSFPVGNMPEPLAVTLPANDAYSLTAIDFSSPAALTAFKVALVQGSTLLYAPGAATTFSGAGGAASLYVVATAATGSAGSYAILIKRGATTVFSKVDSVVDNPSNSTEGYVFKVTLPTAGNYSVQLRDFIYPQAFATLSASASQNGALIGTPLAAPGTLNISNAVAGELNIAVVAKPANVAAPALPAGLFGVSVSASGSVTPLFEQTQGVGGNFISQVVTASANTHYTLSATDFAAPLALDQLRIVVTRGSQQVASIFGGGTLSFDATAGDYTLNFLSNAKASPGYGMYGINLAGVSLTSSASSVASGGSVTLNWNTDASDCVASGGWSGAKAVSGSASIGPLTANTTFTLTCSSGSGSAAQSVNVAVAATTPAAAGKSGGGGAFLLQWLLALGALLSTRRTLAR